MSGPLPLLVSTAARAELRVYEPLSAFSPAEQQRWRAYVESGRRAPNAGSETAAGAMSVERLLKMADRGDGEAHVTAVDGAGGEWLICPRRLDLRSLIALLAFRRVTLPALATGVLSDTDARAVAATLERQRARHPDRRIHIRSSPWQVPAGWFIPFHDVDRRFEHHTNGLASVRYTAPLVTAVERVEAATHVIASAGLADLLVESVRTLGTWLAAFATGAIVELDYTTVACLFEPEALADDHSAREVHNSLDSLARGDMLRSGFAYARLNEAWAAKRAIDSAS